MISSSVIQGHKVLGCLQFGSVLSDVISREILNKAWDHGVRDFDVATLYGSGQAAGILGQFVKDRRLDSRLWCSVGLKEVPDPNGVFSVESFKQTKKNLSTAVEEMLTKLDTDYIDLLNVHAPDDSTPIEETLEILDSFIANGSIRQIGYSNFIPFQLQNILQAEKTTGVTVSTFQLHGNLIEQRLLNEFQRELQFAGKQVFCYRPFARGLLGRNYTRENPKPSESRATRGWRLDGYLTEEILGKLEDLARISTKFAIPTVQLALIWLFQVRSVDGVIFGARTIQQLNDVLDFTSYENLDQILEELVEFSKDSDFTTITSQLPLFYFEK